MFDSLLDISSDLIQILLVDCPVFLIIVLFALRSDLESLFPQVHRPLISSIFGHYFSEIFLCKMGFSGFLYFR